MLTRRHFEKLILKYGPTGKNYLKYTPQVAERYWRRWYVNPEGLSEVHVGLEFYYGVTGKSVVSRKCKFCHKDDNDIRNIQENNPQEKQEVFGEKHSNEKRKENLRSPDFIPITIADPHLGCPIGDCPSTFINEITLKRHGAIYHSEENQELFIRSKPKCNLCNQEISDPRKHKFACKGREQEKVECSYCNRYMSKRYLDEVHLYKKPIAKGIPKEDYLKRNRCPCWNEEKKIFEKEKDNIMFGPLTCQNCEQLFSKKGNLLRHIPNCKGKKMDRVCCKKCGKKFQTKFFLHSKHEENCKKGHIENDNTSDSEKSKGQLEATNTTNTQRNDNVQSNSNIYPSSQLEVESH